jgi:hypothetical protein
MKKESVKWRNRFSLTERRRRSQRGLKTRRKRHWEDTTSFHLHSTGSSAPVAAAVRSSALFARARARPRLLLRSPFPSACVLVINGPRRTGTWAWRASMAEAPSPASAASAGGTRLAPTAGSPLTSASWDPYPARPLRFDLPLLLLLLCCCQEPSLCSMFCPSGKKLQVLFSHIHLKFHFIRLWGSIICYSNIKIRCSSIVVVSWDC